MQQNNVVLGKKMSHDIANDDILENITSGYIRFKFNLRIQYPYYALHIGAIDKSYFFYFMSGVFFSRHK